MRSPLDQEICPTTESPSAVCLRYRSSVAILSSREDRRTLLATIDAARAALGNEHAVIDIMVNGNTTLARDVATALAAAPSSSSPVTLRVWTVPLRDKANAWNQYVHHVWPGADCTFFVDGYASVVPGAFTRLSIDLAASPDALAAAALPTDGRSAERLRALMLAAPQINGSLYALRSDTMERLRDGGFQMPLGLYRIDALIASALNYNLSPATHEWEDNRITVTVGATWRRRVESIWTHADRLLILRRMVRQAFARFEERAFGDEFVQLKTSPMKLPDTALELVEGWMRRHPAAAVRTLIRQPLALVEWMQFRRRTDWHLREVPPERIFPA